MRRAELPQSCRTRNPGPGALLSAALGALLGCQGEPRTNTRGVALHQLSACPLPDQDPAVALEALGDFPADPRSGESLDAGDVGRELSFPSSMRALTAQISGLSERFLGLGEARSERPLDVLLWPEGRSCPLAGDVLYPSLGGGQAMAFHPERALVLVAGGNAGQSSAVVGALTFRVDTGSAVAVDASARNVLLEPRAFAAAAPFGDDLIVTGGENPVLGSATARPVQRSAEVYLVDEARFSTELVELRVARARHAAVVLASGEVLLIGGRGEDGSALSVLEAISPESGHSSLGGLASLADARVSPRVVRLTDGRLLIGGGETADGAPVSSLEWLSSTAERRLERRETNLPAYRVALSALPGGGALFVLGCAPAASGDACAPCARGCPTDPAAAAHWVRSDGTLDPVELPTAAPSPELVPAADGSPWLFTGNEEAPLFRFNPWRARFEPASLRGTTRTPVAPPLAIDAGAFVWLADGEETGLHGVRNGVRGRYARDVGLLVQTAPLDSAWPLHLSPAQKRAEVDAGGRTLRLLDAPVWLTDVDFADVDVELECEGDLPLVWLSARNDDGSSSELAFGGDERPWPSASAASAQLRLRRKGGEVWLEHGEERLRYAGPAGRVQLSFARSAAGGDSTLTRLDVVRAEAD